MSDSRPLLHLNRHDLTVFANSGDAEALAEWQARETGGTVEAAEQMIANLLNKGARSRHQAVYEAKSIYAELIAMEVCARSEPLQVNIDGYRYCVAEYHKCLGLPARAGR